VVRAENVYKTFYTTHKIEALIDVSCGVDKGGVRKKHHTALPEHVGEG
jgi:hypothetical protein